MNMLPACPFPPANKVLVTWASLIGASVCVTGAGVGSGVGFEVGSAVTGNLVGPAVGLSVGLGVGPGA